MPHLPHINIDRFSFWVGFIFALFLVWFYARIKRWFPGWKSIVQKWIEQFRTHWAYRVETKLREIIYSQAQKEHLGISICSLEEIIIEPEWIIPPQTDSSSSFNVTATIKEQAIPFLPDFPELSSQFNFKTITPFKALQTCNRAIIVGHAGYGKTTNLAYIASKIAKKAQDAGDLAQHLPILINCREFSWDEKPESKPIQQIFEAFTIPLPKNIQKDTKRVLDLFLAHGKIMILLDGMDELPPEEYQTCTAFIGRLLIDQPDLIIVTTAAPQLLGGMIELGFEPFPIACWDKTKKSQFISQWLNVLQPHLIEQSQNPIDLTIFSSWIKSRTFFHSPLEWTMMLLSVATGNPLQTTKTQIMQTFLAPLLRKNNLIKYARSIIDYGVTRQPGALPSLTPDSQTIDMGVARKNANGTYQFRCPVFTGFFASREDASPSIPEFIDLQFNPAFEQMYFTASKNLMNNEFFSGINPQTLVLQPQLISALRWLREYPENNPIRVSTLRKMVGWLHDDTLDLIIRSKIIASFFTINDPSTVLLFRQISKSKSESVKYLSLLGMGTIGDDSTITEIQRLLSDESTLVRDTACLALQSFNSLATQKVLQQVFEQGDENLQFAAAEVLATDPNFGHNIILEGLKNENLLIRRAAVHGLAQIQQGWVTKKLEEISISDGQWVVRDFAAQYLTAFRTSQFPAISKPVESSNTPWLIEYASKQGIAVLPNTPADEILEKIILDGPDDLRPKAFLQLARYSTISNALAIVLSGAAHTTSYSDLINYCLWLLSARNLNELKYS